MLVGKFVALGGLLATAALLGSCSGDIGDAEGGPRDFSEQGDQGMPDASSPPTSRQGLEGAEPSGQGTPSGFPTAATTGITDYWCPRFSTLKSAGSSRTISSANTIVEYEEITGSLHPNADNVTFRCIDIAQASGGGKASGRIMQCRDDGSGGVSDCANFLAENVFIQGANMDAMFSSVTPNGASWRRMRVEGGCEGSKFNYGLFMDGLVDMRDQGGPYSCTDSSHHSDAFQNSGAGGPMWIANSSVYARYKRATSAMILKDDGSGPIYDLTVSGNIISGGAYSTYYGADNQKSAPDYYRVENNTYEYNTASVGPYWVHSGFGCLEWGGNTYDTADPFPTPAPAQAIGTCGGGLITPIPSWSVAGGAVTPASCTQGAAACNDIDLSASATGSQTGGTPTWRYSCGGSSSNTMNDGTESRTPCTRGHCLGGYQDSAADLWYDYPACDGLTSCTFTDVCDMSSETAGTYTMKVYSDSGKNGGSAGGAQGTGSRKIRVTDHQEITFTVR